MRKKATILLICFGLGLLLIQIVPAVSGQLPPTPQQPESADLTGPGRLLSEAHALWSKALFDADLIAAQNQCQEALKSYQSAGDLVGQARALNELGLIALKRKRVTEALDFFDQAQNVARTVGDQASAALAIEHRSQAYAAANQLPEALRTGQEALVSYRESRQPQGEARMLIHVGTLHQKLGQSGPAFQSYQQALTTASQIKDEGLVAKAQVR